MNPEAQRIAIAEACGWRPGEDDRMKDGSYQWDVRRNGIIFASSPLRHESEPCDIYGYLVDQKVPDYLNDLNAMHEAEKALNTKDAWETYKCHMLNCMTEPVCATAPQRAEAFLRTLNLWTDE